jgi:hypothetical protein
VEVKKGGVKRKAEDEPEEASPSKKKAVSKK